jgi:hypothetical protein
VCAPLPDAGSRRTLEAFWTVPLAAISSDIGKTMSPSLD